MAWRNLEVARVVIEFDSAFLLSSGEGDGLYDAVFCADANGYPALPGDSLAGVMRHALADGADPARHPACVAVFGKQLRNEGEASRVRVSWAQVHGADDRPVCFRGAKSDEVLRRLGAGLPRDRVRIGSHGAVDGAGKFDQLVVPAGTRFTFELVVDRDRSPKTAAELLALLSRPHVRLGGGSGHGLGRFRVVRVRSRCFDLRQPDDRSAYAALPVALEDGDNGVLEVAVPPTAVASTAWVTGKVTLSPENTWRVGGAIESGREPVKPAKEGEKARGWDHFPLTEMRIEWNATPNGIVGSVVEGDRMNFLVPGSGLRGALRHRSAFHARRLELLRLTRAGDAPPADAWADDPPLALPECDEELALFGSARDDGSGKPGAIAVGDAWIEPNAATFARLQHVSLDQFTQGPIDGRLFDELALFGGNISFDLSVRLDRVSAEATRAFAAAVDDLCHGRLQLGSGRGHGCFTGEVEWSDGGRWLAESER